MHNVVVFQGITMEAISLLHISVHWANLPQYRCNDSSNLGKYCIGGVFKNETGTFLGGFSKHIGIMDILQAELWGIYEGLQLVGIMASSVLLFKLITLMLLHC
ncbi:hypothetical protein GQ457_15G013900 [Hibiscus cannabinus]